jgi:hypothetical protein
VKVRFSRSATDRRLVDNDAELFLYDSARKLVVNSEEHPLDISYDAVQRVIFDVSTRMRGGGLSQVVGGLAGAAIAAKHVSHYWCYIEFKKPSGAVQPYMVEFPKEESEKAIGKMKELFGERVTVAEFPEQQGKIDKDTLQDLHSKYAVKFNKKDHPLPELKPDKALVVVVCPPLAARDEGARGLTPQYRFYANDQVVAINSMGTYSFVYLDPGDYLLVSQFGKKASGFRMKLEAGKDYYFFQDLFFGGVMLSRHTKELVMYEVNGAYLADWKRK